MRPQSASVCVRVYLLLFYCYTAGLLPIPVELHSVRSHLSTQYSLAVLLEPSLACKPQVVMSHRLDDPSALLSLLQQWTAPPEVKSRLEASGFTTLGLLGHAVGG